MTLLKSSSFSDIKSALSAQAQKNKVADQTHQTETTDITSEAAIVPASENFSKDQYQDIIENFEIGLEKLKDVQWSSKDTEIRLKSLLNNQIDMIIRRDSAQKVLFVNDAFCSAFNLNRQDILGSVYHLNEADSTEGFDQFSAGEEKVTRIITLNVNDETRYISWEHIAVR